jgi:hypothetical protein
MGASPCGFESHPRHHSRSSGESVEIHLEDIVERLAATRLFEQAKFERRRRQRVAFEGDDECVWIGVR